MKMNKDNFNTMVTTNNILKREDNLRFNKFFYRKFALSKIIFNKNMNKNNEIINNHFFKNEFIINKFNNYKFNFNQLPKLSEVLINKEFLSNIPDNFINIVGKDFNIKVMDDKFYNLIIFLFISKKYISKMNFKLMIKKIFECLNIIGVHQTIQNKYKLFLYQEIDSVNEMNTHKYDELFLELQNYCENRNGNINIKYWNKFVFILKCFDNFNINDLNSIGENILNKLKSDFKRIGTVDQFSEVTGRKYVSRGNRPLKIWNDNKYQKEFDLYLIEALKDLNNNLISWITDKNNVLINDVSNWFNVIDEVILEMNKYLVKMLFNINEYNNNPRLISNINKIDKLNIENFISNRNRNVIELQDKIKEINSMELLNNKINKLSPIDSPLFKILNNLLNSNIHIKDKQMTIEKAVVDYDVKFFKLNIDNTENKIKIFNIEYINILKNYNEFIKDITINRYSKLRKMFKKDKDKNNALIILAILYMGRERTISLVFKELLNIIFNQGEEGGINKTDLIYMIAIKFLKVISFIDEIKVDNTINNLCNFKELKILLKDLNEINKIHLGDTLFSLIKEHSQLFFIDIIKGKEFTRLLVKINPKYFNTFIASSISLTQLPMIVKPRKIDQTGNYFPYINTNTNVLTLDDNNVIKGKFDQRYKTEGSDNFYQSIDYLNSIKFKINIPMLNFVLGEWNKENSIFFKGYNKYKEIFDEDNNIIKNNKIKHNALYHLYFNIINIASLFRNQVLYLPVFADFRGRLYTLANYLSYQGNDLARSLLLFDKKEILTEKGVECLNVYFSNLGGYDKISWNDRLNYSDKLSNDFKNIVLSNDEGKLNDLIKDLSEPFQFFSIGLAKLNYLHCKDKNINCIINNPILFDASCSGIQHISALTLDKELAKNSNLITDKIDPNTELPEDFYIFALNKIRDKLKNSHLEILRNIKLNRNIIKKSVMTIPYNISMTGIGDQIEEHLSKTWELSQYLYVIPESATVNGKKVYLYSYQYGILIKIIYEVLTKELPSLKNLTNYFKEIITLLNELNLPVTWTTPAGLKIKYQQIKFNSIVTKNKIINTSKPITISIPTKKIDKLKMIRSFMPNFIHSLDASNVHLLLHNLSTNDNIPVFSVHDCFSSTPNNMELLERKVKDAFIEIYFKDEAFLVKTHNRIINQIKEVYEIIIIDDKEYIDMSSYNKPDIKLPDLPDAFKYNNLTDFIKGLLKSKYFIG
jgi:hypothetical protein